MKLSPAADSLAVANLMRYASSAWSPTDEGIKRLMITADDLAQRISPPDTILLMGAGTSVPSGAPAGQALADRLASRVGPDAHGLDLSEVCSIFESKYGREPLASAVRDQLADLQPTGGLLLLPQFQWHRIFSTNFDQLVERAYTAAGKDVTVFRSNADYSRSHRPAVIEYHKIHGCVTTDEAFGHKSRMLLTVQDYEDYADFREASFRTLGADMVTKDVLIVGQSLSDPHLKNAVNEVARLHSKSGTPGRIYLLLFQGNPALASIYENKGIIVAGGGLDDLMHGMLEHSPRTSDAVYVAVGTATTVPAEILANSVSVSHAAALPPSPHRMYNGAAATYADIKSGHTFERAARTRLLSGLTEAKPVLVLIGAAGLGKTTLARVLTLQLSAVGLAAWEHNTSFPFTADPWIEYAERLRQSGEQAVLLLDDCIPYLVQLNRLLEAIGHIEGEPGLRVIVTASTAQWKIRSKSRYAYAKGNAERLTTLIDSELEGLLNLVAQVRPIRDLVNQEFAGLSRHAQKKRLKDRCSAEMFVCLKNIFAFDAMDDILLREFAELEVSEQDIYKVVSALEALGARVHRQLIVRLLGLEAGVLEGFIQRLDGVVSEFDIRPRDGLYGWATRHEVIARTIADFKFSDQEQLGVLFENLVEAINPSEWLEIDTVKSLCSSEYGLARLQDDGRHIDLLKRVIELLPAERIPRHRLIRKYLDLNLLDEARLAIRQARETIGDGPVIGRYNVQLYVRRAEQTTGIQLDDRLALLQRAETIARQLVERYSSDKHGYKVLGDVGAAIVRLNRDDRVLKDAIELARAAEDAVLDPELSDYRRNMERTLRQTR